MASNSRCCIDLLLSANRDGAPRDFWVETDSLANLALLATLRLRGPGLRMADRRVVVVKDHHAMLHASLRQGTLLTVIGEVGESLHVALPESHLTGWISSGCCQDLPPPGSSAGWQAPPQLLRANLLEAKMAGCSHALLRSIVDASYAEDQGASSSLIMSELLLGLQVRDPVQMENALALWLELLSSGSEWLIHELRMAKHKVQAVFGSNFYDERGAEVGHEVRVKAFRVLQAIESYGCRPAPVAACLPTGRLEPSVERADDEDSWCQFM
ncbi:unnamed protein product [Symbiodinium sp. CCMP2592]|nr:unnamed protein product [Symbiodinium sp. CCMP2592]